MKKRMIKLINNERKNSKIISSKACDSTSLDICNRSGYDLAHCTVYAYDECYKDYKACSQGADDICTLTAGDWDYCTGAGGHDYN